MPYSTAPGLSTQSDKALTRILEYIKENRLSAGARLPSEREMSETFEVGRQSVREAIKVLCMMNILEVRKQGGTFVAKPMPNSRYDLFKFYLQSGQISMAEIFEARMALEVECIALAAKNITDSQLEIIRNNVLHVDIDDESAFAEADRELHSTIYTATGNRAFEILMQTVKMWTVVSRSLTNSYREVRTLVQSDHLLIYEALSKRDPGLCREAMRKHMQHVDRLHYVSDIVIREEISRLLSES